MEEKIFFFCVWKIGQKAIATTGCVRLLACVHIRGLTKGEKEANKKERLKKEPTNCHGDF